MSKPRTEAELSDQLDLGLTWRLKELSDLKRAVLDAEEGSRISILRAVVAISYAHWEGYVKYCATKYFEFITSRRMKFSALSSEFYVNSFIQRIAHVGKGGMNVADRCALVSEILDSREKRFTYINPDLIRTESNLKFEVLKDICLICGIDSSKFDDKKTFIDVILLKRRNSIAHGGDSIVALDELDDLVSGTIELMRLFKNELENRIYEKSYLVQRA